MPAEGENSEKTLGVAGLPDTVCSALALRAEVSCYKCGKVDILEGVDVENLSKFPL
jgi:hypothetical protein